MLHVTRVGSVSAPFLTTRLKRDDVDTPGELPRRIGKKLKRNLKTLQRPETKTSSANPSNPMSCCCCFVNIIVHDGIVC